MSEAYIIKRLEMIEHKIGIHNMLKKEVICFQEACQYLDMSHSHLYKLTSTASIPHFKPNGKKIYFNRLELDVWLQRNRVTSTEEQEHAAMKYISRNSKA